jgi:hypothetical protein
VGAPIVEAPPPPPPAPLGSELYGPDGRLRESDERIAGLILPRGLIPAPALGSDRRHVFYSDVPLDKVLRYFGPRLLTGNVERRGASVTYHRATPREARGALIELDVRVEPVSGNHPVYVEIRERSTPTQSAVVTEDDVRRHFEQRRQTAE